MREIQPSGGPHTSCLRLLELSVTNMLLLFVTTPVMKSYFHQSRCIRRPVVEPCRRKGTLSLAICHFYLLDSTPVQQQTNHLEIDFFTRTDIMQKGTTLVHSMDIRTVIKQKRSEFWFSFV
eukprot:GILJ01016950.1.p2 GENE.GILJ01016950.1~~GILJ01016950.1.p2  ORF type:complete len:121 (-),score=11.06 GILJ01016950.1:259-621(-)